MCNYPGGANAQFENDAVMRFKDYKPDRTEFCNDLTVFCSAWEHKGMVLELIRVYGETVTLKDVLDNINYQMDKYENLLYNHHLSNHAINLASDVMSAINDSKVGNV